MTARSDEICCHEDGRVFAQSLTGIHVATTAGSMAIVYGFLYFVAVPVLLAAALNYATGSSSTGRKRCTLVAALLFGTLVPLIASLAAADGFLRLETWLLGISLFWLPAAPIMGIARVHWLRRHPRVLLAVSPALFLLGYFAFAWFLLAGVRPT